MFMDVESWVGSLISGAVGVLVGLIVVMFLVTRKDFAADA